MVASYCPRDHDRSVAIFMLLIVHYTADQSISAVFPLRCSYRSRTHIAIRSVVNRTGVLDPRFNESVSRQFCVASLGRDPCAGQGHV